MKLDGVPFKNSDTCEGVAYSDPKAGVDMSVIEITGRYPEAGWAVNREVHEIVLVLKGMGNLAIKNREITELSEGDVVLVDPGERFAWSGNLTIAMACNPPFDPEQYSVEEDLYEQ